MKLYCMHVCIRYSTGFVLAMTSAVNEGIWDRSPQVREIARGYGKLTLVT